jgi:hypothetical protein
VTRILTSGVALVLLLTTPMRSDPSSLPTLRVTAVAGTPAIWVAEPDLYCAPTLLAPVPSSGLKPVLSAFNKHFPRPGLRLRFVRGSTVAVAVRDPDYLTQKMGSTGAAIYMISATYSITSVPGITRVRFTFEEGDHARPGVYSRASILTEFGCPPPSQEEG